MRTGPGLFKMAMWYHRAAGYGNDLVGHVPGPWDDDAMRAHWHFNQPLVGLGGAGKMCE